MAEKVRTKTKMPSFLDATGKVSANSFHYSVYFARDTDETHEEVAMRLLL